MTCEQPPWLQHLACEPEATRGAPPRMRRLFGVDLFLSLSFWPVSGRFGAPGACPAASGLRVLPGVPWEGTWRATQRHDGTRIKRTHRAGQCGSAGLEEHARPGPCLFGC